MVTNTCNTGIIFRFGDFLFGECSNETYISKFSEKETKKVRVTDIPKTNGSKAEDAKRTDIMASLEGHCSATGYNDLRDRVNAVKAALMDGKQNFYVDEERFIYAQVKSWSITYPSLNRLARFKFQLISDYPFWRSAALNKDTRTPSDGVGYVLYNNGNAPAKVKVTITAPGGGISNDIEIVNETRDDEAFRFTGVVAAGEVLVVDNRVDDDNEFVVTNNGVDANASFEGDFLVLAPGRNVIRFDGTVGETTLEWRDTWT